MEGAKTTFGEVPFLTIFTLPLDHRDAFDDDRQTVLKYGKLVGMLDHATHTLDGVNANAVCRKKLSPKNDKLSVGIVLEDEQQITIVSRIEA